jgi:signal transduction histidine kinase
MLIEEMRRAGLAVDLRVEGDARTIPDGVDRSAYRTGQEALTNTIKHAGLVPTRVTVAYGTDALTLEIVDDGPGQPDGRRRAGPCRDA